MSVMRVMTAGASLWHVHRSYRLSDPALGWIRSCLKIGEQRERERRRKKGRLMAW